MSGYFWRSISILSIPLFSTLFSPLKSSTAVLHHSFGRFPRSSPLFSHLQVLSQPCDFRVSSPPFTFLLLVFFVYYFGCLPWLFCHSPTTCFFYLRGEDQGSSMHPGGHAWLRHSCSPVLREALRYKASFPRLLARPNYGQPLLPHPSIFGEGRKLFWFVDKSTKPFCYSEGPLFHMFCRCFGIKDTVPSFSDWTRFNIRGGLSILSLTPIISFMGIKPSPIGSGIKIGLLWPLYWGCCV